MAKKDEHIDDDRKNVRHDDQKADQPKRINVKATAAGYYENVHRGVGDVFPVNEQDFTNSWMARTEDKPVARQHGVGHSERRVAEPGPNANTPGDVGHGKRSSNDYPSKGK